MPREIAPPIPSRPRSESRTLSEHLTYLDDYASDCDGSERLGELHGEEFATLRTRHFDVYLPK